MPKYTVMIEGNGVRKTVEVDTEDMNATVVESASTADTSQAPFSQSSQGGKRSSSSFRLKKRRITRKLKKTR